MSKVLSKENFVLALLLCFSQQGCLIVSQHGLALTRPPTYTTPPMVTLACNAATGTASIAVFTVGQHDSKVQCIAAIWPNGMTIWSADRLVGGPPYFIGSLTWNQLQTLFNQLRTTGVFDDISLSKWLWAPGQPRTVIYVRSDKRRACMQSSRADEHVFRRSDGRLSCETISQDQQETSASDKHLLLWWSLRDAITAALPGSGKICDFTWYLAAEEGLEAE